MKLRLLIVDDEEDVELLFRQRLRKMSRDGQVELDFAFSGEQALDLLQQSAPPAITLILSDINMPGMSGFELLEKVKRDYPGLKVMMISAYDDHEHEKKARTLGADDFIPKPVDFKRLEERLHSLAEM
ncbi:MAG: response regulator [Bacteroidia bacterium]|nr:response regulator [Bacteroidia bacterium]